MEVPQLFCYFASVYVDCIFLQKGTNHTNENMSKKKYTILVIEDNDINREILNAILVDDYNLLFAENGQVAMDQLATHSASIDLMLLDIVMPVMDGFQVLEAVRQNELYMDIPVIVTTGSDGMDDEVRCLQLGASDFVRKPYNPVVVRLRVESIFKLRESTESNLQKTRFIQNVSHEIRTPLNAIMGFSELLGMPDGMLDAEERANCATYIRDNSQMLIRMIDDMLMLSKSDGDEVHLAMEHVSVNMVCNSSLRTTEFVHPKGVRVYFTSDVPDDYLVRTDGGHVQQILVNLLTNACKFTTEGEIHLCCQMKDDVLCFSVTDTGEGVPLGMEEKIFSRFIKLDSFKPGSGLGLSITRNLATQLGGKVYLDTSYSDGARFVFELPVT